MKKRKKCALDYYCHKNTLKMFQLSQAPEIYKNNVRWNQIAANLAFKIKVENGPADLKESVLQKDSSKFFSHNFITYCMHLPEIKS
jgi:hypothetical protein